MFVTFRATVSYRTFRLVVSNKFLTIPSRSLIRNMDTKSTNQNLIAVCQMTAKSDKAVNFAVCESLVKKAASAGAKMVFLPEACDYMGENKQQTLELAEPLDGPLVSQYQDLAKTYQVWLSLGGIHEQTSEDRLHNTHIVINNIGSIVAAYRKIHLFDVDIPGKVRLKESDMIKAGNKIELPVDTPIGKVGLAICYDMRFPELSIMLTDLGAKILTFPSAFTFDTGSLHWEVLLRARAIENQCFVIAAAQSGVHNPKRRSWGHAMVVGPSGMVIAQCEADTDFALANIDLEQVDSTRITMPVYSHRRYDVYPRVVPVANRANDEGQKRYQFGQVEVLAESVFYRSSLSIAFTNKRCVVPGHVLVAPIRVCKRLFDLTAEEVGDMFRVVQNVQYVIESLYKTTSSTIVVQDGPLAGQTIQHVHVHILPRREGDFTNNDNIYRELQEHDKDENRPWRSQEEMSNEAADLRKYFPH